MIMNVYSVKDSLTEFKSPFIARSDAEAERAFSNLVNADRNEISMSPQYYDLYLLGTYDTDTGLIVGLAGGVKMVASGSAIKKGKND